VGTGLLVRRRNYGMMDRHQLGAFSQRSTKEFQMPTLSETINQEIGSDEATVSLSNGESFRIKGKVESISDLFIRVSPSNNPDKKGRKIVNLNHIVSIDWYVK